MFFTHGKSRTRIYKIWNQIKQRCRNKKNGRYDSYGGRGITISDEWLNSFESFYRDMGDPPPGMTIERKDNDAGYCKENCRWATQFDQSRNKRRNRFIEFLGISMTVTDWAWFLGVNPSTLFKQLLRSKWTFEKCVLNSLKRNEA